MIKKRITFLLMILGSTAQAQNTDRYDYLELLSSPFTVEENYLSKHDIVYFSPTQLEAEGFPMGNGNMGGMIWNNDNGIELQINKNDLWSALSPEEYDTSILKHAARVKIDFGTPVFSWIHLKNFKGRLSLQQGESCYKAETGYSTTNIRTWLAHNKNVWVLECENLPNKAVLGEKSTATVSIERMGSRSFSGWYGGWFANNPSVGLGKTNSLCDEKDMIIEEIGEGLHFAVACRILKDTSSPSVVNTHRAEWKTDNNKFTVLISVVTDRENAEPMKAAVQLLDEAEKYGVETMRDTKNEWHKNFWSNSFVKLGDDYLENIYYLRRYLIASGSQGKFPVAFNGGLWRWNRDVLNWVTPHHWNTQQQYWGLCAQNDCQLMKPYLDTYIKMMPDAEALAKEEGASNDALLITEMHCFTGEQIGKDRSYLKNNYTPASQIASLFWDYYDFTGDKEFLKNKAYVFMKKASRFYLDKLQWDSKRKEYFFLSSVYESADIDHVKNAISDRNCIEQLFKNCIKAASILGVDKGEVKKWNYVLEHLWIRRFQQFETGEVIAPAEEYYTEQRYSPWQWASGGAIAFPTGLIGIDDKNSRLGKSVMNLVRHKDETNAHYPYPQVAARMGMGNEALLYIQNGVKIHQMYPQGLMHNVTGYPDNIYHLESVHDLLNHEYVVRSQAFFQCGMEPISNYATTINEMMLQSNEDKIRVFPAIPAAWDSTKVAFTLLARGAFIVSAERNEQAQVTLVGIKSLNGNVCCLQNPWPGEKTMTILRNDSKKTVKHKLNTEDVLVFATQPDAEYIVTLTDEKAITERTIYSATPNTTFHVLANQKWTAKITEGATWLSMQSGTSGESDGQITVQAQENTGEQRIGIITLYDRHGKIGQEVKCTQGGVVLDPEVPANEKFYTIYQEEQLFKIHIESNTEWEVSKKNEKDDDWYTFQKTSFNGSDDLVINVSAHKGISVRTGIIILTTKASEGTTPIVKTIRFKQANPPIAKVSEVNKKITSGTSYYGPDKLIPGRYNFYLEPLGKTQLNFFFTWKGEPSSAELRYHILNGKTSLSTTPYCNDVNSGIKSTIHEVDTSKPHTLSFEIQEAVDKKDPTLSWIYTEWILDDKVIAKATSDGIVDINGGKDTWILPFARANAGGNFLFKATAGDAVLTKYEYIGLPEWGE